ncbi:MAG: putative RND superfamily exporter protein, partial [Candidatus Omnitrophota bacterium]
MNTQNSKDTLGTRLVQSYAHWVVKWRWLIIPVIIAVVMLIASNMRFLAFSLNYKDIFEEGNPQLIAFETLQSEYIKSDNVLMILEPKDGQVFTKETLAIVAEITEKSWQIPFSVRVDSITNYQHTTALEDDLIVGDLVSDTATLNDVQLKHIKNIALNEPTLLNRLISPEAHVTGVNVTLELPEKDPSEQPEAMAYVHKIIEEIRLSYPDIKIHLVGMTPFNSAFNVASQTDMKTLIPLMFGIIVIILMFLLRSVVATLSAVVIFIFTIFCAMGFAGFMGWKLTAPSASTPTIVLTMAVADCVHLLMSFLHYMRTGMSKHEAIKESLRVNMQPIFLTSVTTAIGFLSMNFSKSPPFQVLGNMVAFGVMSAFFLSVTLLPAIVSVLPIRVKKSKDESQYLNVFAEFVINQRKPIMVLVSIVVIFFMAFLPRNQLNDQFTEYFDKSVPFRQASDFANETLGGTYSIDYSINTAKEEGISEPEFLVKIEAFSDWLSEQPEVVHVNSISDTFKRLNKNMHGDDPSWYRLPDQKELASQYLLLYEMSLPYGLDLNNQVNFDKSATRVVATLESLSTIEMLSLEDRAKQWLKTNMENIEAFGASPTLMFAHVGKANVKGMMMGTTLALILISFILIIALRSFRMGIISLAPNLFPAAVAFGIWGLAVAEVGMSLAMVSGMTLGIVVDDTVHFLSKYIRARREQNMSAEDAVRYAFSTVGSAIVITSIVLVAGFSVLTFSTFRLNSDMGLVTAMIIAI